jgi:hypothetical protein
MRRTLLGATVLMMTAAGRLALAQAPAPPADDHAAHHPAAAATKPAPAAPKAVTPAPKATAPGGQSAMGGGMMGGGMCPMMGGEGMQGGMMGGGMMGGGMMGGMGQMMGGATTKVDVKKVDKGVTITMTSPDPATAARLQKMAEAMRLMHEATAP